jgi:hypothetical protein
MDNRKQVMILDGATDLYTLIRDLLRLPKGDERVAALDRATETYLKAVLALEERPPRPALQLIEGAG